MMLVEEHRDKPMKQLKVLDRLKKQQIAHVRLLKKLTGDVSALSLSQLELRKAFLKILKHFKNQIYEKNN
jgi:hypothetical protein